MKSLASCHHHSIEDGHIYRLLWLTLSAFCLELSAFVTGWCGGVFLASVNTLLAAEQNV